jgi:hypothetical protein
MLLMGSLIALRVQTGLKIFVKEMYSPHALSL